MKRSVIKAMALTLIAGLAVVAAPTTQACSGCGCQDSHSHPAETAAATPDIVDTAVAAGQFNTLVAAVQAADLVDALKAEGPYTVFAPTDEAFAALPEGALENLLANPDQLKQVLLYHVVAGEVKAEQAAALDAATTLQGQDIAISLSEGNVLINGATVIAADIETSNGVIHVIDHVILPPQPEENAGG